MVEMPAFTSFQKKMLSSILTLSVLVVGMAVGTVLVLNQDSQDFRRQASVSNVDLSLTAPPAITIGQSFQVNVVATNLHAHQVTAADLQVNYPANLVRLDSITPGPFFNKRSNMLVPYPTVAGNAIVFPNITPTPGVGRIALGAFCDYCFLGPTPLPTHQPQPPMPTVAACGAVNPSCYPITASNMGANSTIATYNFTAISAGSVQFTLGNSTSTLVASIGNDVNVVGDLTGTSVTINAAALCNIDLDANGTIGLADYGAFKTRYLAFLSTGTYDATIDIDGNGSNGLADYGAFKTKYLTYLQTGTCN